MAKDNVAESLEELVRGGSTVEYAIVEGFEPGQSIRIGSVSAGDMIEWSEANEGEAKRTAGLRLICKSLVNSEGKRYANDPKNVEALRLLRHKETERIVKAILELNGLTPKKEEAAKNV